MKSGSLLCLSLALTATAFASGTGPKVDDIHPEWMDKKIDPIKDFFGYCNGAWLAKAQIPAEKTQVSADTVIIDRTNLILRKVAEAAAANRRARLGTVDQQVGDFYKVGTDEARANRLGFRPIEPMLREIQRVNSKEALMAELGRLSRLGLTIGVSPDIEFDLNDSSKMMLGVSQPTLTLGDRDVYLQNDERAKRLCSLLIANSTETFRLLGDSQKRATEEAAQVLDLEKKIAKVSRTVEALRSPKENFHPADLAGLQKTSPGISWKRLFANYGVPNASRLTADQPDYLKSFSTLVTEVPLSQWKTYMRWELVQSASPYLSAPFVKESQKFAAGITGQQVLEPRWKRVLRTVDDCIGEDLGQLYVRAAFPPRAKEKALDIVHNIRLALQERLNQADWLSDSTKKEALAKLDMIRNKIGYPDKWRDYSKLSIRVDSYAANVIRSREFETQREINKLGKPVDRGEWGMTPQTDNAYYDSSFNEVVFPAGILQQTYFDVDADDAANYGGFGATIGHEITHGFDDDGRMFDGKGNLRDWWTKSDEAGFQKNADALAKQFDQYTVSGGIHLKGKQTLGENIADLGGLVIAYRAFQLAEAAHPEGVIDGMTPEQRFFVSYGQSWRSKIRPQLEQQYAKTDVHSPPKYRVDGVVINVPDFYKAFGAEVPKDVVRIW